MKQCLRYVRRLSYRHSIAAQVHATTMCGGLVRLYRCDAAGFACSRAYDIRDEADDLDVMFIIAL